MLLRAAVADLALAIDLEKSLEEILSSLTEALPTEDWELDRFKTLLNGATNH